jgi:hypothetical protein
MRRRAGRPYVGGHPVWAKPRQRTCAPALHARLRDNIRDDHLCVCRHELRANPHAPTSIGATTPAYDNNGNLLTARAE